jgi:two-component system response regulator AtoC
VRFVGATNRDLEAEIVRGTFRQDLYFRLNGITLVIPPLRERTGEIPDLAAGFLRLAAERNHIDGVPGITAAAMAMLRAYAWPGNIRELRNVMERALLLAGGTIDVEHLPLEKLGAAAPAPPPPVKHEELDPTARPSGRAAARGQAPDVEAPLETFSDERARILEALNRAGGNQTEAAKLLGYSRRKLIDRVIHFHLPRPRKRS